MIYLAYNSRNISCDIYDVNIKYLVRYELHIKRYPELVSGSIE